MSDVIEFFERVGQDAQWSQATQDEVQIALAATEIAQDLKIAIGTGDQIALGVLMGIAPMCAMLSPAKEEEKEDQDDEERLPGEESEGLEKLVLRSPLSAD